jgi:hypothetical protein
VLASVLRMIKGGATHIAVATDHVIESFRNGLWPGYKTGEGIDPDLLAQFQLLEDVLSMAGVVVWPMVEFEADDALAAAATAAARDPRVERVIICTPDKDLAQCVRGTRIVQLNRRTRVTRDEAGVLQKFGVRPASIPDYLAGMQTLPQQELAEAFSIIKQDGASAITMLEKLPHQRSNRTGLQSLSDHRTGEARVQSPPTPASGAFGGFASFCALATLFGGQRGPPFPHCGAPLSRRLGGIHSRHGRQDLLRASNGSGFFRSDAALFGC